MRKYQYVHGLLRLTLSTAAQKKKKRIRSSFCLSLIIQPWAICVSSFVSWYMPINLISQLMCWFRSNSLCLYPLKSIAKHFRDELNNSGWSQKSAVHPVTSASWTGLLLWWCLLSHCVSNIDVTFVTKSGSSLRKWNSGATQQHLFCRLNKSEGQVTGS